MKKINRIRLINWHYFSNETLNIKGSFLLTGENKSGKSTILDAIQFILTANSRNFNKSANEKSKRDLKGYIRCKTGIDGKEYLRSGNITSYVAIEFFDDKSNNYFVIGTKVDSPDVESSLDVKWFIVDSKLDNITFMIGNRPAMDNELRLNDTKINLIKQQKEIKSQIMRRLGNIDARFFDLIPQSIAFKPMDNVKEFINKFILQEHQIDVQTLQKNIQHLDELKTLMNEVETQINQLTAILKIKYNIDSVKDNILIYNIMIQMAKVEKLRHELNDLNFKHLNLEKQIDMLNNNIETIDIAKNNALKECNSLEVSLNSNDSIYLIHQCEYHFKQCQSDFKRLKLVYDRFIHNVENLNNSLSKLNILFKTSDLISNVIDNNNKISMCQKLSNEISAYFENYNNERYNLNNKLLDNKNKINQIQSEINLLKDKKLSYPASTVKLKNLIETEFRNQHIISDVYIFCDTLEITDNSWQNSIEGYLNTQRFYILVEPKYYDIALDIYNKHKNTVSSVGLVNTNKLDLTSIPTENSLANYITSHNRYSQAYANYLLGKVTCCNDVSSLKNYSCSITKSCMLYQNYAVKKINSKIYEMPYIGTFAVAKQLEIKQLEYTNLIQDKDALTLQLKKVNNFLSIFKDIKIDDIINNINIINDYSKSKEELSNAQIKYNEAKKNPTYLELIDKKSNAEKNYQRIENQYHDMIREKSKLEYSIQEIEQKINICNQNLENQTEEYNRLVKDNSLLEDSAVQKYNKLKHGKTIDIIISNFNNNRGTYERDLLKLERDLERLQMQFDGGNLGVGYDNIEKYIDKKDNLERSELIKYKDDLAQARQTCETIFHQDFLAKLKEQIENAQKSFRELNKSLHGLYYGEDTYYFKIDKNKSKEALYKMIMSQNNIQHDTDTFFSMDFENQYREEIDELFTKLTASNDMYNQTVNEYTDYRNYLDYDIKITNKQGDTKWFSKIYANMSGGEAQTPYYVAIASSFLQIYNDNTINVIILDEAFDKMDDERIQSMMEFFKQMGFQIILGTPPSKMEIIGEFVDEILMVIRVDKNSIVEEYLL